MPNKNNLKIHFVYVVSILAMIIIALLTQKVGSNDTILKIVDFGLPFTSIMLAMIAIIYSFYSNTSFAANVSEINLATKEVQKAAENLSSSTQELDKKVDVLPQQMKDISESMKKDLVQKSEDTSSEEVKKTKDDSDGKLSKKQIDTFLRRSSLSGLMSIYLCKLALDNKKLLDFNEIQNLVPILGYDYFHAYLVAIYSIDLLDSKDSDRVRSIDYIDERLIEQIKEKLVESVNYIYGKLENSDSKDEYLDSIKKVEEYFQT